MIFPIDWKRARPISDFPFLLDAFLEVVWVPPHMDETQEIDRLPDDLVIDIKREWFRATTTKTMRPDMIASLPSYDFSGLAGNSLVKSAP